MTKMQAIMDGLRSGTKTVGGAAVIRTQDYINGLDGLPPSDVLKFYTENSSVVIRPSGTEPKLKIYISAAADEPAAAARIEQAIKADIESRL